MSLLCTKLLFCDLCTFEWRCPSLLETVWILMMKWSSISLLYFRMERQVSSLQSRLKEGAVGQRWSEATAAFTYLMAVPPWPPPAAANPSKRCCQVCVRREASLSRMSSFIFTERTRWGLNRKCLKISVVQAVHLDFPFQHPLCVSS